MVSSSLPMESSVCPMFASIQKRWLHNLSLACLLRAPLRMSALSCCTSLIIVPDIGSCVGLGAAGDVTPGDGEAPCSGKKPGGGGAIGLLVVDIGPPCVAVPPMVKS